MPLTFPMTNTCINRGAGLQACGGRLRPPVPLREERVLEDRADWRSAPQRSAAFPDIEKSKWPPYNFRPCRLRVGAFNAGWTSAEIGVLSAFIGGQYSFFEPAEKM